MIKKSKEQIKRIYEVVELKSGVIRAVVPITTALSFNHRIISFGIGFNGNRVKVIEF